MSQHKSQLSDMNLHTIPQGNEGVPVRMQGSEKSRGKCGVMYQVFGVTRRVRGSEGVAGGQNRFNTLNLCGENVLPT